MKSKLKILILAVLFSVSACKQLEAAPIAATEETKTSSN